MPEKKVNVRVLTDVDDDEVEALEKKVEHLKLQKLQVDIDTNTSKLQETEDKIKSLKTFLDNVNKGNTNIKIEDSEIKKAEAELESLEAKKLQLEIAVETGNLKAAEAEIEQLDDQTIDVDANMSMQNISQGIQQAKQGLLELKQGIDEVSKAGMQSEQNLAFLSMNLGAEKARDTYKQISDIVASMPGDDNTMRSVLSTAQALGNNLNPNDMRAAAATMADYMSGSATMGKQALESQQDIMKYLLDGNTAELERGSIVSAQVDKLKQAKTFQERQVAMQQVLNDLGYGGISQQDTMLNKQAEWEGMIYNSQDALSSMWLGAEKGAMDYILQLNDATNGIVGMGIVAGQTVAGPFVDLMSGVGQVAMGMKSLKGIYTALIPVEYAEGVAGWFSIGWIALAIILGLALGLAFVYLYKHSEQFRNAVNWLGNSIKWLATTIWNKISGAVTFFINAIQAIPRAIQSCLQWAYNLIMNHPIVRALRWLGETAAYAFKVLGLGQHSPGKIVQAMQQELDWTTDVVNKSNLAKDTAKLGDDISGSFNPNLNGSTSNGNPSNGTGGDTIINIYGDVDNERRINQIVEVIRRELSWNNETAGRTV